MLFSQKNRSEQLHYGWVIIAVASLVLFACFGLARYAYAMILPGMQSALGLTYDQSGFIGTGNFVGYLLSVLAVPLVLRRITPRVAICCGLLLISIALLAISFSSYFWQILPLYFLAGVGGGFANIPLMLLTTYWFHRSDRGRALGLALSGNGAGIVLSGLLVPYLNNLAGTAGWRASWLALGLICLLVTLLAGIMLRNSPAEMGLEPIGKPEHNSPELFMNRQRRDDALLLVRLGLVYLAFGATFMIFGTFFVTTMVKEYGLAELSAGRYWSWVGFFSLFSGIIFGGLSDRIGRKGGLALVLLVQTTAYLLAGIKLGGPWLLVSIVLYGASVFAIPTIMTAAVAEYMGLSRAASAFATVTLFFAAGQSTGPAVAGVMAKSSGGFSSSYLLAAVTTLLAALLAISLPRPDRQDSSGQT